LGLSRFQSHPTGDIGFEQPERQENDLVTFGTTVEFEAALMYA
jgi:hypothetical protein